MVPGGTKWHSKLYQKIRVPIHEIAWMTRVPRFLVYFMIVSQNESQWDYISSFPDDPFVHVSHCHIKNMRKKDSTGIGETGEK